MLTFKLEEPEITVQADVKTLMLRFALTPQEAQFLQAMLVRSWVGVAEFPEIEKSIRQVVYTLRKKVEGLGVLIVNNSAGKYTLPPGSKLALQTALQQTTGRVDLHSKS